jgi:hypothetical protein
MVFIPPHVLQVFAAGAYDATMFYTSKQWAVFKLSVGSYQDIQDGTAPSIKTTLPAVVSDTCNSIATLAA